MLRQVFNTQKIGKLTRQSATVVSLPGNNYLKLGGIAGLLSSPQLSTAVSGVGGMESPVLANTLYYVYAVRSGTTGLIASTSNQGPAGILAKKKVGAFQTNSLSEIIHAFGFGSDSSTEWEEYIPTLYGFNSLVSSRIFWRFDGDLLIQGRIGVGVGAASTAAFSVPNGLQISTDYVLTEIVGDLTPDNEAQDSSKDLAALAIPSSNNDRIFFAVKEYAVLPSPLASQNGNNIPSNRVYSVRVRVPVTGWSSTLDWLDY